MNCPKCKGHNIETWYAGGRRKARCLDCLWHGLAKSLSLPSYKVEIKMPQLYFDFIPVMDQELAEKRRQEAIESKRRIEDSWLHSAVERLPPEAGEWDVILMGIRLSRHVHHSECERCKLATHSHCPDALGTYWDSTYRTWIPIKVCIKDYYAWCGRHGLKDLVKKNERR